MFLSLFYMLRARGLRVSLNEWMLVQEGLRLGLHNSTFTGFYRLCKAVAVHSEVDYDAFDQVFLEYFKELEEQPGVSEELLSWLKHPERQRKNQEWFAESTGLSRHQIEQMFAKRLQDQKEEHNGGKKWIGTNGYTAYGNQGKRMEGIRVGEQSTHHSAYRVMGERRYRDWRWDQTLDQRQYQVALRKLRQLTKETDYPKTELDVDATIQKTCDNAGRLRVEYTRPRKNAVKVVMLIDSGGSMEPHQQLCSMLFQSVQRGGSFRDLKIYYFHNALQKQVYLEPTCDWRSGIPLDGVLRQLSADYRVIFVGDGVMAPEELLSEKRSGGTKGEPSSLQNFLKFKAKFAHIIWLHPQPRPLQITYFTRTFAILDSFFDMRQLTVEGLSAGFKKLMVNH